MNAYVAQTSETQQLRQVFLRPVLNWFASRLATARAARSKRLNIEYLSSLDRRILEDVGINSDAIPSLYPRLAGQHAAVLAATLLGGTPHRDERW